MLLIVQFTFFKLGFQSYFLESYFGKKKILSFLTFSWDKDRLQTQSYSILGRKKQPPSLPWLL